MALAYVILVGKDIALLVINGENDCDKALNPYGQSKFVLFGLNAWILSGSIIHMVSALFTTPLFENGWYYVICSCFLTSWAVIGFILYSEMDTDTKQNEQCGSAVLAWGIIGIIEIFSFAILNLIADN
eukprot:336526_1